MMRYRRHQVSSDFTLRFLVTNQVSVSYFFPKTHPLTLISRDCFASALMMMKYGSEHVGDLPWNELPVVHFDIKPANGKPFQLSDHILALIQ